MSGDPKTNEWNSLKDQFVALVQCESISEESIEKNFDDQIYRRFGEWITWASERKKKIIMPRTRSMPETHGPR